MTKWIRWSGLAGFLAVIGLIAALFILLLPFAIKSGIEFVGTKVAGAKVTVDDADVTLSPLGVRLERLQVADAREPMRNLVEFDEAVADLELAPLLVGKAISNELSVTNLQFHTQRATSGAIAKDPEEDAAGDAKPSLKEKASEALPSVDEVLAKETLKTPQAGEALKESWNIQSEQIDAALKKVPDSAALANYETEVKEITSGRLESVEDFRERKARLDALKKQFEKDRSAIRQARDAIQEGRSEVSDKLAQLRSAPGEDLAYLKDKYQLSGQGVSNLTGLLFGDDAANWAQEALYWYEKVQPYLESDEEDSTDIKDEKAPRLAGEFVHFPTDDPWPDFLIRTARLTGPFSGGQLVISGKDITHQQIVTGRPTVFTATGDSLERIGDLDARLTLNHTLGNSVDTLTLAVSDWAMAPLNLGVAGARLASSQVKLDAEAKVVRGELDAELDAKVSRAQFTGDGQTLFARELNAALKGINRFSVDAGVTGSLKSPDVTFGSDLDRQINSAITKRISAKQDEFEARLKSRLNSQVAEYAGDYADELQQLTEMEGSLDDKLNALKDLASQELEDFKAQQEREAREKLEAEKAAAEQKAKEEADARKQDLKNQAKDKLKSLF